MLPKKELLLEFFPYLLIFTLILMSNLDLWYFVGVSILGISFAYITLLAAQFMGVGKKEHKSSASGSSNPPPVQFLRQALLAFVGIMIGAQFLQYHQEQETLSKNDIGNEMAIAGALSNKPAGASGYKGMNARPTARPPRGEFSLPEAGKAGVSGDNNSRGSAGKVLAPVTNVFSPSRQN